MIMDCERTRTYVQSMEERRFRACAELGYIPPLEEDNPGITYARGLGPLSKNALE